ncbi:MAG TPA: NAD(P)H-binding protein [Micromonosporaceae bacterium]|nr:NAD(P)H-binding protein [Micromonosporaceae bacterium]
MKVVLFGATGMVGSGVLRECLHDGRVTELVTVGRSRIRVLDPKLRDVVHADLADLSPVEGELAGADACFFCLGVSVVGRTEEEYTRVTYDMTMAVADTVARVAPGAVFVYVSGAGTDSTEKGRAMWARVKGRTENALLAHADLDAYMFRPGFIQPMHGVTSRTRWYRVAYAVTAPITPVVRRVAPTAMTTTEEVGLAMLTVASAGWPDRVLATRDIVAAAAAARPA